MLAQIPPRNDTSPCVVYCAGRYSEIMPYVRANELAMQHAAKGHQSYVYRLIEETVYYGGRS